MRVLHFFTGNRVVPSLMIDFVLGISKYCEIFVYGPYEQELSGKTIAPIRYDPKKPLKEVIDSFKPDLLLLPEYQLLTGQFPRYEEVSEINDIPKVSIEFDSYVLEDKPNWHLNLSVDFVITRGPAEKKAFSVPSIWLPFSVEDEFYLKEFSWKNRFNKILFIGGGRFDPNKYYRVRKRAIFMLERADLLDYYLTKPFDMYKAYLRSYKHGLSCSFSELRKPPAKNWEIPASGCLLFTSDFLGRELIFGDKLFIEYKDDCSDLVEKAEDMLTNDYSDLAYSAWKTIGEKHLHSIRVKELYDTLVSVWKNEKVKDRWDIG